MDEFLPSTLSIVSPRCSISKDTTSLELVRDHGFGSGLSSHGGMISPTHMRTEATEDTDAFFGAQLSIRTGRSARMPLLRAPYFMDVVFHFWMKNQGVLKRYQHTELVTGSWRSKRPLDSRRHKFDTQGG